MAKPKFNKDEYLKMLDTKLTPPKPPTAVTGFGQRIRQVLSKRKMPIRKI